MRPFNKSKKKLHESNNELSQIQKFSTTPEEQESFEAYFYGIKLIQVKDSCEKYSIEDIF